MGVAERGDRRGRLGCLMILARYSRNCGGRWTRKMVDRVGLVLVAATGVE